MVVGSLLLRIILVATLVKLPKKNDYAGGFIGSHSKKTSSSPFFGVEVSTIMTP